MKITDDKLLGHVSFQFPAPMPITKWQSGYATDCNSVYAGSIPALVSNFIFQKRLTSPTKMLL
jgi:hypothetical protein